MASKVDAQLLRSTKFPPEFRHKVDMQKVNLQVMKKWIANRISDILGNEDDVVIELCFNLIEGSRHPDIKSLQIQLTGFLDKDTAQFCKELWNLLLSAQGSPQGVPKELLEAKKLELMQEKMDADRAAENARKQRQDADRRDREVSDLKQRDRRDRANYRADTWQGRRGNNASDSRPRRGEQDRPGTFNRPSEIRSRGSRDSFGRDIYIPDARRGRDRERKRRRDPSSSTVDSSGSRSRSRDSSGPSDASNSPPRRRRSPPRNRSYRKRSRSPRGDAYRPRPTRRDDRDHRYVPARLSRSVSSDRSSPTLKKRKRPSSRSRSPPRRKRRSSSPSSSGSGGRSRSRSHGRRSPERREHTRRHSGTSHSSDHSRDRRSTSRRRPDGKDERSRGRRQNSSSVSPVRSRRRKSVEAMEDERLSPVKKP
ncbi:hypothetical protein E4U39_006030 [Claviceps sp. Clav50 group G5]|nr:hypothetical protein E4U39_006030 [Claviceps sp. Clav50 group G5]